MHRDKLRTAANKLWFPWRSLSQCEERTDPEHRVSPRIHGGTGEEVSLGPHDAIIQHTWPISYNIHDLYHTTYMTYIIQHTWPISYNIHDLYRTTYMTYIVHHTWPISCNIHDLYHTTCMTIQRNYLYHTTYMTYIIQHAVLHNMHDLYHKKYITIQHTGPISYNIKYYTKHTIIYHPQKYLKPVLTPLVKSSMFWFDKVM